VTRRVDGRGDSVSGQSGSGSVLAVAIVAALLMLLSLLLPLSLVLAAKQRAAGAADAAALAAADVAVGLHPGSPCPVASTVAEANGAALSRCLVEGSTVTVRTVSVVLGLPVSAQATAGQPAAVDSR
jgi:secretion/DNA translocation related TadE-like protein